MTSEKHSNGAILLIIQAIMIGLCANALVILRQHPLLTPTFILLFLLSNGLPLLSNRNFPNWRLRICNHGCICLKAFFITVVISVSVHILLAFVFHPHQWGWWLASVLLCIIAEGIIFWNGIICVYTTSVQLGVRHRIIGLLLGAIPIVHLFTLWKIIRVTKEEVDFELQRYQLNQARSEQQICSTKYPILLVHGVFFRDSKYLNYWGRIPQELTANGAKLYYGEHQSASSIEDSATELAKRIRQITAQTGCEKVNIIAHSKGGLDCRYAISYLGMAPYVASLTTINTPHRGCQFADYLLEKVSKKVQGKIASAYNGTLRKFGDSNPDFLAAVNNLRSDHCTILDKAMPIPQSVYCHSVGSKLNFAAGGKFPLNFSYHLVKHFDGPNDGLVGETAFQWGNNYTFLTVSGRRGISHGDMIDLNRENIPGFDVREFYIQLTADLKNRGL